MDRYRFCFGDIREKPVLERALEGVDTVIHLAALVGFPACDRAGPEATFSVNLEGTRNVYERARAAGVSRFLFASSYSNYGIASARVDEDSELNPQSTYAESKVAAETYLIKEPAGIGPVTICVRLATLFGISPRTRFDLMVNQFALAAHLGEGLVIYQQDFNRAFVHVQDVVEAMLGLLRADPEIVDRQIFNVGGDDLNSSKSELVALLKQKWPDLQVEYRNLELSGDMRSIHVSFKKIRSAIGFVPGWSLRDGIDELHQALATGLIRNPSDARYRNHPALVL
jgi:nucleoside-diphosphate-sugar epimerase